MTSPPEAPPAPVTEQAPPAPAPAAPAAPRVPPGEPGAGQFAPAAPPQQAPAQPPAAPAQPETDWKAQAEAARAEAAAAKAASEQSAAEADRWKRQARNQEQRSKANHQQVTKDQEFLRLIAEKVGVEYDDRPDPDQLLRQLEQERLTTRQRTIELATFTMAANTGANAAAILDSREFMLQAEQLDPSAADFSDQVRDLVKAASAQPRYQFQQPPAPPQPAAEPAVQQPPAQPQQQAPPAQPPAPSSGSDFSGAPGGNRLWTQADYDHWTAPGMDRDGDIMTAAINAGLLAGLGIPKPKAGRTRR